MSDVVRTPIDYQAFVDAVAMPCCVISVERRGDSWGEIRIAYANQAYHDTMGPNFHPGMVYSDLVPKEIKFEDFCFRSALCGQRLHSYVETKALGFWTDQTIIPLASNDPNMGYCQFIFEFTKMAEARRMATVSAETSEAVIRSMVNLRSSRNFRESASEVAADLRQVADAYRCRILVFNERRRQAKVFVECIDEGRDPDLTGDAATRDAIIPYELVKTWDAMIGVSNALILKDERDMAEVRAVNPEWADHMREHGVRSLILIPLRRDEQTIGYLYVTNFDTAKTVMLKELMELMSYFLGSELYNHLLLEQLGEMSRIDGLTGLLNRNAMIRRMEDLCGAPFGVINLDLNGLKLVNDSQGHDAGDRLLVQAAEVLRKVFYQEDVYRTGGDEFIVIAEGIGRDTFERKVERFRSDVRKNVDVSFAMGSAWSDGSDEVNGVFRRADESMYADKQRYYEEHPDLRR